MSVKRHLLFAVACVSGLLTLIALLLGITSVSELLTNWASFLATIALLLGVLNLFAVHLERLLSQRSGYSGVLIAGMLVVFGLAITDSDAVGLTENGLSSVFEWVQSPLEAALASLLAFFLLIAGYRLLQRRRNVWSILFAATALFMLLGNALIVSGLVPAELGELIDEARTVVNEIVVTAGMRGILIGVALGTIMISLRLLIGLERPYGQ
jgi:hypothetical protein